MEGRKEGTRVDSSEGVRRARVGEPAQCQLGSRPQVAFASSLDASQVATFSADSLLAVAAFPAQCQYRVDAPLLARVLPPRPS